MKGPPSVAIMEAVPKRTNLKECRGSGTNEPGYEEEKDVLSASASHRHILLYGCCFCDSLRCGA